MTRIEYERKRRGWNQTVLAFHAQLTQSDISLIERRRFIPTENYIERIARALGADSDGLLDEVHYERVAAAG